MPHEYLVTFNSARTVHLLFLLIFWLIWESLHCVAIIHTLICLLAGVRFCFVLFFCNPGEEGFWYTRDEHGVDYCSLPMLPRFHDTSSATCCNVCREMHFALSCSISRAFTGSNISAQAVIFKLTWTAVKGTNSDSFGWARRLIVRCDSTKSVA